MTKGDIVSRHSLSLPSAAALVVLSLVACGKGSNPDRELANRIPENQRIDGQAVHIVSGGDTLQFNGGTLEGTGAVLFAEPLPGKESANKFTLRFEIAPNGKVAVVGNSDASLNGVEVEFARENATTVMKFFVRARGVEKEGSSSFSGIDASQPLTLAVDIHNDEGEFAHIQVRQDETVLFDSAEITGGSPGNGSGPLWGLKISDAKVMSAIRSEPASDGDEEEDAAHAHEH